jgi:hypothetical protein
MFTPCPPSGAPLELLPPELPPVLEPAPASASPPEPLLVPPDPPPVELALLDAAPLLADTTPLPPAPLDDPPLEPPVVRSAPDPDADPSLDAKSFGWLGAALQAPQNPAPRTMKRETRYEGAG